MNCEEFIEMDPPIIHEASFSAANLSSYSLAEIWPFPINNGSGGLGLRMNNLSGFGEATLNRDVSVDESTVTEQSGGGGRRKQQRREANSEDESSKLVSTSSGNDMVEFTLFFQLFFHLYVCSLPSFVQYLGTLSPEFFVPFSYLSFDSFLNFY